MKKNRENLRRLLAAGVAGLLLLTLFGRAQADDRDLVREAGRIPYLMVLFDVSGSMNWQPPDAELGIPGDSWAPAYGDDPNSKFYQAKSALFRVVSDPELADIFWGFSTYNQDFLRVYRKHWLYTPSEPLPWNGDGRLDYPMPGDPKHFGDDCMDDADSGTGCDLDSNDVHGGCSFPYNIDDAEDWGEIVSFPVLDDDGRTDTAEWVEDDGRHFRLIWDLTSGELGDETIEVELSIREADPFCRFWIGGTETVTRTFERVYETDKKGRELPGGNEALFWQIDSSVNHAGQPAGFWNPDDNIAYNTCEGWEPNNDPFDDPNGSVLLKYPTTDDPADRHSWVFDRGDVIPLDPQDEEVWGTTNRELILKRLAPNYDPDNPTSVPELRVAPYFEDHPDRITNSRLELKPEFAETPPLVPNGSTPIGNSMLDFMRWFDDWKPVADDPECDPFFGCRTVNLLILTDGDETCYDGGTGGTIDGGGDVNPCWIADLLLNNNNRNVRTWVIGFGVPGADANFLNCIAERGGTDDVDIDGDGEADITGPILPGNEDELVDALKSVIEAVRGQERSFASAAVPQGQATVNDKAYLTSFLPLADASIWPARVDAYLRPIPLREVQIELPDGSTVTRQVPDPTEECATDDEGACHLWNAGEQILEQAASDSQVSGGDYNLGNAEDDRRVFHARELGGLPSLRLDFDRPVSDADWHDLLVGMEICEADDTDCSLDTDNRDRAIDALDFFHRIKRAEDPRDGGEIEYLLGDVFHSDPVVLGNPDEFKYWVGDVGGSGELPLDNVCTRSPGGYRCFFAKHQFRRKMLLMGADDGQMHAFDAGVFRGSCATSPLTGDEFVTGEFDDGSGREIFSYVPRMIMPTLLELEGSSEHRFTVDGRVATGDAHIDPLHGGTPDADDREWRSVIVGGLREGGSGYYALDVTQPDAFDDCGETAIPEPAPGSIGYVPSCLDGGCADTLDFPAPLWEFTDTSLCGEDGGGDPLQLADGRCDSDQNGFADLGETWSTPTIARIRVLGDGGELEDRYVAVFGGGSDPSQKGTEEAAGNHIFMVDIETGEAIFKRRVPDPPSGVPSGSVPSALAAVSLKQDAYLDTVYFGTTGGFLYKMDLSQPLPLQEVDGAGERITGSEWDPFPIFDTDGRPIYFQPAVVFVAELGQYALAFGTGDREDLWTMEGERGRIYMILDDDFAADDLATGVLPKDETDYQGIDFGDAAFGEDLLQGPPHGWYLRLDADERVITRAFSLAGITVLSSFQPLEQVSEDGSVCRRYGNSRVVVVTSTSANPLLASGERFFIIPSGFLSTPFAETGQTKNVSDGDDPTADDIPENINEIIDEIRKLFPDNCRFANYTINIKAVRDDTGIQFLAAVPVCSVEMNWREF